MGGEPTLACNALALRPQGGGVHTYIRELLRELPAACGLGVRARVQRDALVELPPGVEGDPMPVSAGVRRALQGMRGFDDIALVHGLDVDLPLRASVPMVSTVHDLSVFDVPWAFSRFRSMGERILLRRSLARADRIVAVSCFTAERVQARFGREVQVTPLAPSPLMRPPSEQDRRALHATYDLPETFVVQVATIEPRKGAHRLAGICRELDVPLVLAGGLADGMRVPDHAQYLGYVDLALLPALYAEATAVAYLSTYEGFGLPPVEAAACGAPVLATSVGALPEVLGDGAALVPVTGDDALRRALRELIGDEAYRTELAAAGMARVEQLSWLRTARETAAVYRSLGVGVGC